MHSHLTEESSTLLMQLWREADGCRYRYALERGSGSDVPYAVLISFASEDGYTTSVRMPLLLTDISRAQALLTHLCRHLVTPVDLPYVLEDLFAV